MGLLARKGFIYLFISFLSQISHESSYVVIWLGLGLGLGFGLGMGLTLVLRLGLRLGFELGLPMFFSPAKQFGS